VVVPPGPIGGRAMRRAGRVKDAALMIEAGQIAWFGPEKDLESRPKGSSIDARGGCVVPGLIDPHTHAVFAGTREDEFVQRIEGRSYAQIAEGGGGIRVTVDAVRAASRDQLVEEAMPRLGRMLHNGVTTAEIKSGYGLSVADEIKILEAIGELRSAQPVELAATYLAAHTTPREFADDADAYLDCVIADDVLAAIRDQGLAEFCDVFCEAGAFTVAQSRRILETGRRFGLSPKIHADQITQMGASKLACEVEAVSADHLEQIDPTGIAALKASGTVAVLLPGCAFFLGVEQAPARRMLEADLPVALATDFNPGSSMIESLPLVMSIACMQMRLTPMEALIAATANAAAALKRQDRIGAIQVGMQADLVILTVHNLERWLYEPGRNCIATVVKAGRVVASNEL